MPKMLIWLLLSLASAILYRAGGMGKEDSASPRWMPKLLRQRWLRIWGVPLVSFICMLTLLSQRIDSWFTIMILLSYGLNGGAISTYWDNVFGYDNFYMHGFFCGLALFPLCFSGIFITSMLARAVILGLGMGIWSLLIGSDEAEEYGRGFLHTLTIPILLT